MNAEDVYAAMEKLPNFIARKDVGGEGREYFYELHGRRVGLPYLYVYSAGNAVIDLIWLDGTLVNNRTIGLAAVGEETPEDMALRIADNIHYAYSRDKGRYDL